MRERKVSEKMYMVLQAMEAGQNAALGNICARRTHDLMRSDSFLLSGETRVGEKNCPRQTMRASHLLINESSLHFGK